MLRLFQASFFYRLLDRLFAAVTESFFNSGIYKILRFFARTWTEFAKGSIFVKLILRLNRGFSGLSERSFLLRHFLHVPDGIERSRGSIVYKLCAWVRTLCYRLVCLLGLEGALADSLFAKPAFWCIFAVTLTPFLPTMAVLGPVLLSFLAMGLELARQKDLKPRYFSVSKYVYFYAFIYILATAASWRRGGSAFITALIVAFLLFTVVLLRAVRTRGALRTMIYLMAAAGAAVALYGLYQFFISAPRAADAWVDQNMFDIDVRVFSTFENPNVLGTYFLLIIPLALACMITVGERVGRVFFAGAVALMGLTLILTYSRGAYLGILVALALFFVLLDKRFIVPGVIALVIAAMLLPDAILTRFLSIGDMTDTSTAYRVSIWMGTLSMIGDHWLVGIGPGLDTWQVVYPVYAYAAAVAHHSHNLFLQILAELGVLGFLVFVLMIYHFYKYSCSGLPAKGERRVFSIAVISAVTGFLVMGLTDYALYNYRLRLLFWAVLGIGFLNRVLSDDEEAA